MRIPERQLEGILVTGTPQPDHREHITFRVGVVGNRPKIGPPNAKKQVTTRLHNLFPHNSYFENVKLNRKAENLHPASPLVTSLPYLLCLALFKMALLNHLKESYRQHDRSPLNTSAGVF